MLAAAMRMWDLGADPPATVDGSFISDEGWWAHNARNHYLYGRWITDDFNHPLYAAPVHTFLLRASFGTFGIGLVQARVVEALSGLVTLAALAAWLHWNFGRRAAVFGAAVFAVDYFSYSHHRVAMIEANATAMMAVAVALCAVPRRHSGYLVAAGAVGILAVFTKTNSVCFVPALVLAAMVTDRTGAGRAGVRRRSIAWLALGGAGCALLWLALFVFPNWEDYLRHNQGLANEGRILGRQLITQAFSFGLQGGSGGSPVVLGGLLTQGLIPVCVALVWLWFQSIRVRRDGARTTWTRMSGAERVALVWIAFQFLYLATNHNAYDRRYVSFVFPMIVLGAAPWSETWRDLAACGKRLVALRASRWGAALVLALAAALYLRVPIAELLAHLTSRLSVGAEPGLSLGALAALATIVVLVPTLPLFGWLLDRVALRAWPVAKISGLAALLSFAFVIPFYGQDWLNRTHTIRDTGQTLAESWGPNARVYGGIAETLLLSSSIPTMVVLDRRFSGYGIYGEGLIEGFSPTHVIEASRDLAQLKHTVEPLLPGFEVVPDSVRVYGLCPLPGGDPRFLAAAGALRRREDE